MTLLSTQISSSSSAADVLQSAGRNDDSFCIDILGVRAEVTAAPIIVESLLNQHQHKDNVRKILLTLSSFVR